MGKIYGCFNCKTGFNFDESAAEIKNCPNCQNAPLTLMEDWEGFDCEKCHMNVDVLTAQMHANLKRIEPGILKCKYDNETLKIS
jgi:Zn finger protein HypA/HybF involved in hydrogenase expression